MGAPATGKAVTVQNTGPATLYLSPSLTGDQSYSLAAAQGCGAFLSNAVGGAVAKHAGHNVAFLILAAVAAAGLVLFWRFMPETGKSAPDGAPEAAGA